MSVVSSLLTHACNKSTSPSGVLHADLKSAIVVIPVIFWSTDGVSSGITPSSALIHVSGASDDFCLASLATSGKTSSG